MMCDRDVDALSNEPGEAQFQAYVRERFWNERSGAGGWHYNVALCLVRRNDRYR